MPTIRIRPQDLGALMARHARELPGVIRRGLVRGALRGKAHLVKKTPTNTGQLRNSWDVTGVLDGGDPELHNFAPYVGIVERGARPHPVSQEGILAIAQWAKRKLQLTATVRSKARDYARMMGSPQRKFGKGEAGKTRRAAARKQTAQRALAAAHAAVDDEALRIAHAIAWKLRHHGQKATYFVRSELEKLQQFNKAECERVMDEYLRGRGQ